MPKIIVPVTVAVGDDAAGNSITTPLLSKANSDTGFCSCSVSETVTD